MSFTLQTFVDRLFLTWYSQEAVAGAVTSLFTVWVLISLFLGTGEYLTTFIAQYYGAGRPQRIGAAVWQGIYFSLAAGLLVAGIVLLYRWEAGRRRAGLALSRIGAHRERVAAR